jgi:hypothetical protein
LRDFPGFVGTFPFIIDDFSVEPKEDGSYRLVGLPGPGLVGVWYLDDYLRVPDRHDEYGIKEPSLSTAP